MQRILILSVLCLAIAGLRAFSAIGSVAQEHEKPAAPAVESAPSPFEDLSDPLRAETLPAAGLAEVEVWEPTPSRVVSEPTDPAAVATLAHLRSRHTGLSGAELPVLAELIVSESRRYGLDPALALAVIRVESGCFNYAVSQVGAMGLMQVMPATGEELAGKLGIVWRGQESLFDPRVNVQVGIAYLKQLSDRYGSTRTALAAYNWGPGRIDRRLRRGQSVPKLYVSQVLRTVRRAESSSRTS